MSSRGREAVAATAARIQPYVRVTPVVEVEGTDLGLVEPGGATALAGVLSAGYDARPGERIAVVVCGGNTEAVDFDRPARIA